MPPILIIKNKNAKFPTFSHQTNRSNTERERERESKISFSTAKDFVHGLFSAEELVNLGFGRAEGIELVVGF